ncbi:MAG: hypothetical protein WCK47_13010, partial [bacterium]
MRPSNGNSMILTIAIMAAAVISAHAGALDKPLIAREDRAVSPTKTTRKSVFDQPLIAGEPKPEDKSAEETGTAEPLEASPNVK